MSGRFLLDTNIVIALFNTDANAIAGLSTASDVFSASIVIGELYYGAHNSSRVAENMARVSAFAASNVVLECDVRTAEFYGQVKSKLRAKGRPLPENDIWIAALALQYDLTLATWDAHFDEVDDLKTVKW